MSTYFIQANLQHSKGATANLSGHLRVKQKSIVLIQEPWVNGSRICGLNDSSYSIFYATGAPKPRTCIYLPLCVLGDLVEELTTADMTVVKVDLRDGRRICLASLYLPYDAKEVPPSPEFVELVEYAKANGLELIIGCDANSHHVLWGSSDTNKRGEGLMSFISTTQLDIMNRGCEPTFINKARQEVIDITMVSNKLSDFIKNWHVSSDISLSDHRWIRFEL